MAANSIRRSAIAFAGVLCLLGTASMARAQQPTASLAAQVETGAGGEIQGSLVPFDGRLYFAGTDTAHGTELWRFDGAGASLVADIVPGAQSSNPLYLTVFGNRLCFAARHATLGAELWCYDGSTLSLVADINAGSADASPSYLAVFQSAVYFAADDGTGREVWRYDGAAANKLIDLEHVGSSEPADLTVAGGALFFTALEPSVGRELWRYDGVSLEVSDLNPGSASSSPQTLTAYNGSLFFAAQDSLGLELWRHDGIGAARVKDIRPGGSTSAPSGFVPYNGYLYFTANDGVTGFELWRTDGTLAGTQLAADIKAGSAGSVPSSLIVFNNALYMQADSTNKGAEIHRYDGVSVTLVADVWKNANSGGFVYPAVLGSRLFFRATDGSTGLELWSTDGTTSGTARVADIYPGGGHSLPQDFRAFNLRLHFDAFEPSTGRELWATSACSPGAETCNGVDEDCDGVADDGAQLVFYRDRDGDGFGDTASPTWACALPAGHVLVAGDCDDALAAIHPGAAEACNGLDDDCDGSVDDGLSSSGTFFRDVDGDGYGDDLAVVSACVAPPGYVTTGGDCHLLDWRIHPAATETCNGLDDDCDGLIDEGLAGTYYRDQDGDGYGNSAVTRSFCPPAPAGWVGNASDCDDGNAAVRPGAPEACNGLDDDCDGAIDESGPNVFYRDADGDGHGEPGNTTTACTVPAGYSSIGDDCDDNRATIHPGAPEVCNFFYDDDCDGQVDEGLPLSTFYRDQDFDGYAGNAVSQQFCGPPGGWYGVADDCDDADPAIHPGQADPCDGVNQDCDGPTDEDFVPVTTFCGAGACARTGSTYCNGVVLNNCQPGAPSPETCNNVDDNCNGYADDNVPNLFVRCGGRACGETSETSCSNGVTTDICTPYMETIIREDAVATREDQPIVFDPLRNDCGLVPGGVAVILPPLKGSVSVNQATGRITYSPHKGASGNDLMSYRACDAAQATCLITQVKIFIRIWGDYRLVYHHTLNGVFYEPRATGIEEGEEDERYVGNGEECVLSPNGEQMACGLRVHDVDDPSNYTTAHVPSHIALSPVIDNVDWSPSGDQVMFHGSDLNTGGMVFTYDVPLIFGHVNPFMQGEVTLLTYLEGQDVLPVKCFNPSWGPDGILCDTFVTDPSAVRGIYRVIPGFKPTLLFEDSAAVQPDERADGRVAFSFSAGAQTAGIGVWQPGGINGQKETVYLESGFGGTQPEWSPDGRKIAFLHNSASFPLAHLGVVTADGSNRYSFVPTTLNDYGGFLGARMYWDPIPRTPPSLPSREGGQILFRRTYLTTENPNGGGRTHLHTASPDGSAESDALSGPPTLYTSVGGVNVSAAKDARYSPDGQRIAYVTDVGYLAPNPFASVRGIVLMNIDGAGATLITPFPTNQSAPEINGLDWSPDGQRLAVTADAADGSFRSKLWTMRTDGTDIRLIADLPPTNGRARHAGFPSWSPDGQWILFTGNTNSPGEVSRWVARADGTAPPTLLTDAGVAADRATWSPSGGVIAMTQGGRIHLAAFVSGTAPQIAGTLRLHAIPGTDSFPIWSPTGQSIAFTHIPPSGAGWYVAVANVDGTLVMPGIVTPITGLGGGPILATLGWRRGCVSAEPEICDGLDNDCDGAVDEGFDVGAACSTGAGSCLSAGYKVCNADRTGTTCFAVPPPTSPEICDGLDNDCDGTVDGFTTSCGVGQCAATGTCTNGGDTCQPGPPSTEVCDGIDNDCDGVVDLDAAPPPGVTGASIQRLSGTDQISWTAVPGATSYDVVRVDLRLLRQTGGNFSQATTGCAADNLNGLVLNLNDPVASGGGLMYIVRAANCGGGGTYESGSSRQQGFRDPEIVSSPSPCP